jgi:superfamily II DNA or RNA helicase
MTRPELRPYQREVHAANYAAWQSGIRHVVDVVPTGGGKSVIVGQHAADDATTPGQNVVIAHRQELVSQMSLHVARFGVFHRIIAPKDVIGFIAAEHRREFGRSFVDPTASTAVAGVDTLKSRHDALADWAKQVKRWTIDEAHHVLTNNKWGYVVSMFPNAFGLGVTATPNRADGNGIGDKANGGSGVFGKMVIGPSTRDLINMGALSEYEIAQPESDLDVAALKITDSGDFSPKQLREASQNSHIVGDVVEHYIRFAYGKSGITFATDVDTATEIAIKFQQYGIPAVVVTGKTPDALRSEYVRRFRAGQLWQLVNVDLFGEGFDLPGLYVVSMARPTASLGVYLQQFGRVLRPMPGKRAGLVIDHVGNSHRFGYPDKPRVWSLANRERRAKREFDPDDMPLKTCVKCVKQYEATKHKCPYCGYMPVPMGGGRDIKLVDGDLTLLDAETLAKLRSASIIETPEEIWAKVAAATNSDGLGKFQAGKAHERIAARQSLANAIALWAGHGRAVGQTDSELYRRFYHATGGVDVASALGLPKLDMDTLRAQIMNWIAQREN